MTTPDDLPDLPAGHTANAGYALGQLERALATGRGHPDAETRRRAQRRVADWLRVAGGMVSGALRVGSRTPVAGVPAWVTTQVMTGGFATGDLPAGGPLRPHELALIDRLGPSEGEQTERARLNAHFLTEAGLGELLGLLASGCYRVDLPEEGALLTVAWLAATGHGDAAARVLAEIEPWADRLRFYPVPSVTPLAAGGLVRLQDAGALVRSLRRARASRGVREQAEAFTVWAPHEDCVVALLAETIAGEPPVLVSQEAGGRSVVAGGWPFATYPDGWAGRAQALLIDYDRLRASHPLTTKPHDPASNPARLRRVLALAAADPARLTGRDVGIVRTTLAQIAATRGLPGSERLAALRAEQARIAALPAKPALAEALAARLDAVPAAGGLTPAEADAALDALPPAARRYGFRASVLRAVEATPEQHVAWGTITSGEALARVVPPLAAQARSAGLADPALRRLDEAVYAAFRRRRSVLLLDLASQVRVAEVPWVRETEALRETGAEAQEAARAVLARVVSLALVAFPWQILPNKLLQEVRALVQAAGLDVPVVDEIAADIFMGTFTEKYLRAAQAAARSLGGSPYARYYGIDAEALASIADVTRAAFGAPTSPAFAGLCLARAGQAATPGVWKTVAENGAVIEQEQVLTTHNLAPLADALGLREALADRLPEMAQRTLSWTADTLERLPASRGRRQAFKNAAYAWRQFVVFLSLVPPAEAEAVLAWARADLAARSEPFRSAFTPALDRLATAVAGDVPPGRPFYGWVAGESALLGSMSQPAA